MYETEKWVPGTMQIAVMGSPGDTKKTWDPNNPDEVEDARRSFDYFRGKGYLMFRVQKGGDKGEQMRTFDPSAERMIAVPQMQGG